MRYIVREKSGISCVKLDGDPVIVIMQFFSLTYLRVCSQRRVWASTILHCQRNVSIIVSSMKRLKLHNPYVLVPSDWLTYSFWLVITTNYRHLYKVLMQGTPYLVKKYKLDVLMNKLIFTFWMNTGSIADGVQKAFKIYQDSPRYYDHNFRAILLIAVYIGLK